MSEKFAVYKHRRLAVSSDSFSFFIKMAGSIKIFQFIQKYYQTVGIFPSKSHRIESSSINVKNVVFFIGILPYIVSLSAFLAFQVNSMLDVGISVFILISMVSTVFFYIIPTGQMKNTLMFVANCERFIEQRK